MAGLSIEEKAKLYDETIERAKRVLLDCTPEEREVVEYIYPELEDSKDEKIRKELIEWMEDLPDRIWRGLYRKDILAWLEKQGEHEYTLKSSNIVDVSKLTDQITKLAEVYDFNLPNRSYDIYAFAKDILAWIKKQYKNVQGKSVLEAVKEEKVDNANKVESTFKVGDWVVTKDGKVNQVVFVDKDSNGYTLDDGVYFSGSWCNMYHLWSIEEDAKDGDLIYVSTEEKGIQAIFDKFDNGIIYFHCYLCGDFIQGGYMPMCDIELAYPLQKTHHQRFFQKMKEAGYEWSDKDRKLIKIVK